MNIASAIIFGLIAGFCIAYLIYKVDITFDDKAHTLKFSGKISAASQDALQKFIDFVFQNKNNF